MGTAGGSARPGGSGGPPRAGSPGLRAPGDLAALLVLAGCWGSAFAVIRLGLLTGASPLAFGAARFALAAALMAVVAAAWGERRPDRRTLAIGMLFGGVVTIGAYAAFLNTGEETVSGGLSSVLIATVPLFTVVFSFVLLAGERPSPLASLGLLVGFGGVIVLFLPELISGGSGAVGEALVVGAALAGSGGAVALRRFLARPIDPWTLTAQFAMASVVLALASLIPGSGGFVLPLDRVTWEALLYLAAVASVLGYTIFFALLHRGGPTRASLVTYLAPPVGIAVGVGLLGESVSVSEVAGLVLIFVGLVVYDRARRAPGGRPVRPSGSAPDLSVPTGTRPGGTG